MIGLGESINRRDAESAEGYTNLLVKKSPALCGSELFQHLYRRTSNAGFVTLNFGRCGDLKMLNRRITLSILLIVLIVLAAYGTEYLAKNRGLHTATMITIQSNNKTAALFGVDVLRQLDAGGPGLFAVLAAAGIDRFSKVEVKGIKNNTVYQINIDEINKELNLRFTDRGTVNLCNNKANKAILVEDVNEINAVN